MSRIRWYHTLVAALIPGAATWLALTVLMHRRGWVPPLLSWGAATALCIAVVVLALGWGVKRLREGKTTPISPFVAALTAVAAQASIVSGAALCGVYAAEFVTAFTMDPSHARHDLLINSVTCFIPCLAWLVVGYVVEAWCTIEDDDDDTGSSASSSGTQRTPHSTQAATRNHP